MLDLETCFGLLLRSEIQSLHPDVRQSIQGRQVVCDTRNSQARYANQGVYQLAHCHILSLSIVIVIESPERRREGD